MTNIEFICCIVANDLRVRDIRIALKSNLHWLILENVFCVVCSFLCFIFAYKGI